MKKSQNFISESEKNKVVKVGLVYYSICLDNPLDDNNKPIMKADYPNRYEKKPCYLPQYKNQKIESLYNKHRNSSIIPTGEVYNNIGIDVDSKDDTIEQFNNICEKNNYYPNTFTIRTMHDGFHYHYALNDDQKQKLKKLSSLDGKLFNLHIDVKYNNQILFGPTKMIVKDSDEIYEYKIENNVSREILPEFIFNEIINCIGNKPAKKNKEPKMKKNKEPINNNENIYNMNDKRLECYLDCLNDYRADDYNEWIKIIYIITNENGSHDLIHKFSKRSKKWNENECNNIINSIKQKINDQTDKRANMTTLINMAKEDNYEKYKKALLADSEYIVNEIIKKGISDVMAAYLFYSYHPNDYIYDVENKELYKINKYGIYQMDHNDGLINNDINDTLLKEIEGKTQQLINSMDNEEKKSTLYKQLLKNRGYLLRSKNKIEIVKELKLLYGQIKLFERLDKMNPYVFAFSNGVYDLSTNTFRNAKPEELITCTCNYNYEKPDQKIVSEITGILEDIMINKECRDYLLTVISLGLLGSNPLEEMYIWIGTGRNGKGLLRDMILNTLGDYFDNMEIEYLCQNGHQGHGANAADPVMARKKNSRMVITTEVEGDVHLRCAKLKQISGNDPIQVRNLYKSPFNFVPVFKLIIQTNNLPHINGDDQALGLRMRLIKFGTTFTDNPIMPHERKINRGLKDRIKNNKEKFANAFFSILLQYYNIYANNNNNRLDMPEGVKKDTMEYLHDNDTTAQFIDARITKTTNKKDFVSSSELYSDFQKFCEENKYKLIKTNEFKNTLIKKGFVFSKTKTNNGFAYIKLNENPLENGVIQDVI